MLLFSDLLSHFDIVQCDGKFELVVQIGSDLESKLLLIVVLEELSQLAVETVRDLLQVALSLVDLVVKDANLEVHHGEEKSVGVDVEVLVDKVQAVLLTVVTKDVLLLVRVAELHDFASDKIVHVSSDVDESEAVSRDPKAGHNCLTVLINEFESLFKTILHIVLFEQSLCDGLIDSLAVEVKQVEGVFKSESHLAVVLGPIDVLEVRGEIDSPHNIVGLPVIERDAIFAAKS